MTAVESRAAARMLMCRYCNERAVDASRLVEASERQFGLGGRYRYATCDACGALALLDAPDDPSAFYPRDYYSLAPPAPSGGLVIAAKRAAKRAATRYALTGAGLCGRLVSALQPSPAHGLGEWLLRAGVTRDSRILDVGCGAGALLDALADVGYTRLCGVDPFLREERHAGAVRLYRRALEAHDEPADFVMLHHVLEHVPDPRATLDAVRRLLAGGGGGGGHALVRVPIVPSEAWERYGAAWVQLDAPRHVTIPSERGLALLAARSGLRVVASAHDSTPIQFWGSELYRRGLTLQDGARTLSWLAKRRGALRARQLNAERRGDQAAFLLAPA